MATVIIGAMLAVAGCGEVVTTSAPQADDPPTLEVRQSTPSDEASSEAIHITDETNANLLLWVSNQSFIDDPVVLTVSVDGVVLVDQPFEVEGQHNWILFPVELPAGSHVVKVASGTGAAMESRFRAPAGTTRYAVVDYWNYADREGRHITWRVQDEPVAFA